MPTANVYEQNRLDTDITWSIFDIDGADAYHEATNTIRVRAPEGRKFRVFLVAVGNFVEPDHGRFKCAVLYNAGAKPITPDSTVSGIGFLIDIQRFEQWKLKGSSFSTIQSNATGEAGKGSDTVIKGRGGPNGTGISLREDGTIIIKSNGAEIALGDSITIQGQVNRTNPETRSSLLKSNPMRQFALPSFCVLPLPSELPDFSLMSRIGGITKTAFSISNAASLL
jgi:hypothetical protein